MVKYHQLENPGVIYWVSGSIIVVFLVMVQHGELEKKLCPKLGKKHLVYEQQHPLLHPDIKPKTSVFEDIKKRDILLHYPYQTFNYIIDLLREAAIDPHVKSIKISLYRLAKNSNVINALINARRNGKSVTVVMELQARFDEEANIRWTKELAAVGAKILDGVPGLKVHAKLCQITRIEKGKETLYTYISTGNFNESTARIYSDHGLLTSHKKISQDVHNVFDFLESNYKNYKYKHLLVAPFYMRSGLKKLINTEIKNAQNNAQAYMYIKLNSLVDQELIKKLYKASQAGVKIKMIIRGICSLVPGIPGLSDNIEVYSIIDKYLEHSRIFIFCNGGDELYYISSADWMIRNLDNRIEVATPVYDASIQNELKQFMEIQLSGNVKARIIDPEQSNRYKGRAGRQRRVRVQDELYNYLKDFYEKRLREYA